MINWKRMGEKRAKLVRIAFVGALVTMLGSPVSVFAAPELQAPGDAAALQQSAAAAVSQSVQQETAAPEIPESDSDENSSTAPQTVPESAVQEPEGCPPPLLCCG